MIPKSLSVYYFCKQHSKIIEISNLFNSRGSKDHSPFPKEYSLSTKAEWSQNHSVYYLCKQYSKTIQISNLLTIEDQKIVPGVVSLFPKEYSLSTRAERSQYFPKISVHCLCDRKNYNICHNRNIIESRALRLYGTTCTTHVLCNVHSASRSCASIPRANSIRHSRANARASVPKLITIYGDWWSGELGREGEEKVSVHVTFYGSGWR